MDVQGVTTGIIASVEERLASEGLERAFNLKEEFPAEYMRLLAGETADIEITPDHLPFFLRSANARNATLVFTRVPEDAAIEDVEFDRTSVGAPTKDETVGGVSVDLPISGKGPWRHTYRLQTPVPGAIPFLLLRF
jgi:hypothetical protein